MFTSFYLQKETIPILTIRLELIQNQVTFRPPLEESTSVTSVQEVINKWMSAFLARSEHIAMLGPKVLICLVSDIKSNVSRRITRDRHPICYYQRSVHHCACLPIIQLFNIYLFTYLLYLFIYL